MGKQDFRTPLGKVRGLGSAGEGTGHFIKQRLTAIANIPLFVGFILVLVSVSGKDHSQAVATLSHPLVAALMLGVVLSGLVHMRLGMQVIIKDYVKSELAKVALLAGNTIFTVGIGVLCILSILKLALGG